MRSVFPLISLGILEGKVFIPPLFWDTSKMKKLSLFTTLIFSLTFSASCFAEWKNLFETPEAKIYVDSDSIKNHGGYVYYWELYDFFTPIENGAMSMKAHRQVDCKYPRSKFLNFYTYTGSMGQGTASLVPSSNNTSVQWIYPPPGSKDELILGAVCKVIELR
jgi:hypothetical protein